MQIKDIAKLAGVAPSTVSRVINNSGYVSAEIREKVGKIIEETGYVPNSIAKSLKAKKTNMIGFIIPQVSSESMARTLDGVSAECNNHGYDILLANSALNIEKELQYLRDLNRRQIDGIILMSIKLTKEHYEQIMRMDIPVVVIGQKFDGLCCVTHNDVDIAYRMTKKIIEKGRRNIAMINVMVDDDAVKRDRFFGYRRAVEEAGFAYDPEMTAYGEFTVKSGYECMKKLWESGKRPDGVFAISDKLAVGAMKYLREQGVSVPDDVSVTGIGNNSISYIISPSLTTAEMFPQHSGSQAAIMLFRSIESGAKPEGTHYVDFKILERESI